MSKIYHSYSTFTYHLKWQKYKKWNNNNQNLISRIYYCVHMIGQFPAHKFGHQCDSTLSKHDSTLSVRSGWSSSTLWLWRCSRPSSLNVSDQNILKIPFTFINLNFLFPICFGNSSHLTSPVLFNLIWSNHFNKRLFTTPIKRHFLVFAV